MDEMLLFFLIFIGNIFSTLFFIFIFKKISYKLKITAPNGIPLVGLGIGAPFIISSYYLSRFIQFSHISYYTGIIVSSAIILGFGFIDDLKNLSVSRKLFFQIIAATFLIFSGIRTNIAYIGAFANILITYIWVIGITNSFNLLDVADGLAAGIGAITAFSLSMTAIARSDAEAFLLSFSLFIIILTFIPYNSPPAKVYMGNTGSHFLGFVLSAIALSISYASLENKIALLTPILILGYPIFDTLFLILMRVKKRKSIFKKSDDHLSLRLLKIGYSQRKTLLLLFLLSALFSILGYEINLGISKFILWTLIGVIVLFITILTFKVSAIKGE